jgi:hypothetical protein
MDVVATRRGNTDDSDRDQRDHDDERDGDRSSTEPSTACLSS